MRTLVYTINTLNQSILLKKTKFTIKHFNNLTLNVLAFLQAINIIDSFLVNDSFTTCTIFLTNVPFFQQLQCISVPNHLVYMSVTDLRKIRTYDLYNDYLISSTKHHIIMKIDEAIRTNTGGLVLLKILI